MGVASSSTPGAVGCTSGEREEALLDLHGLHGTEAIGVLESWLVALEGESFLGLGEWARGAKRSERERGREGGREGEREETGEGTRFADFGSFLLSLRYSLRSGRRREAHGDSGCWEGSFQGSVGDECEGLACGVG